MTAVVLGLSPLFLAILVGWGLNRWVWPASNLWEGAETLTYYVFFPALLFTGTAKAEVHGTAALAMIFAAIGAILLVAAALWFGKRFLGLAPPAFGALFQCSFRPNTYIALGSGYALLGPTEAPLVAVCLACIIPTVNLLAVTGFLKADSRAARWRDLPLHLLRNPLILACVGGGMINLLDLTLPPVIGPLLELFGRAALPLALLAVGAGLDMGATARRAGLTAFGAALKLLAIPALAFGLCLILDVTGSARMACLLASAAPTSLSSYVLARRMGGDAPLTSGIITVSTIAAAMTVPLVALIGA
ncbi:MAG: AEC family transporter [Magnetospiraceae bacterium]